VREHAAFDLTEPLASIDLDGVLATDLGAGSNVEQNLRAARIRIRTALAAETVGVGQAVLEGAVEYATTREQFGRAIGSFQSIKHLLVDSYLALDGAEVLSQRAARAVDDDEEDAEHLSRLAMFVATSAAVAAAQNSLQTFGGIGYTWEQGTHRYLRRARARAAQFGRPGVQLAAIADDILVDAGSEPVA
jgi:alkylation response protein AidB-like acyl-CoA dehydrogenase